MKNAEKRILKYFMLNIREFSMEMKHLIIFAIIGMIALLGFNMMNGNQRDKDVEAITASSEPELANSDNADNSNTSDIASKPLGQQPKAILDNATAKIDEAQQADARRCTLRANEYCRVGMDPLL